MILKCLANIENLKPADGPTVALQRRSRAFSIILSAFLAPRGVFPLSPDVLISKMN